MDMDLQLRYLDECTEQHAQALRKTIEALVKKQCKNPLGWADAVSHVSVSHNSERMITKVYWDKRPVAHVHTPRIMDLEGTIPLKGILES